MGVAWVERMACLMMSWCLSFEESLPAERCAWLGKLCVPLHPKHFLMQSLIEVRVHNNRKIYCRLRYSTRATNCHWNGDATLMFCRTPMVRAPWKRPRFASRRSWNWRITERRSGRNSVASARWRAYSERYVCVRVASVCLRRCARILPRSTSDALNISLVVIRGKESRRFYLLCARNWTNYRLVAAPSWRGPGGLSVWAISEQRVLERMRHQRWAQLKCRLLIVALSSA